MATPVQLAPDMRSTVLAQNASAPRAGADEGPVAPPAGDPGDPKPAPDCFLIFCPLVSFARLAPGCFARIALRRRGLDPDRDLECVVRFPGDYQMDLRHLCDGSIGRSEGETALRPLLRVPPVD